jgi:hypothetical protein
MSNQHVFEIVGHKPDVVVPVHDFEENEFIMMQSRTHFNDENSSMRVLKPSEYIPQTMQLFRIDSQHQRVKYMEPSPRIIHKSSIQPTEYILREKRNPASVIFSKITSSVETKKDNTGLEKELLQSQQRLLKELTEKKNVVEKIHEVVLPPPILEIKPFTNAKKSKNNDIEYIKEKCCLDVTFTLLTNTLLNLI